MGKGDWRRVFSGTYRPGWNAMILIGVAEIAAFWMLFWAVVTLVVDDSGNERPSPPLLAVPLVLLMGPLMFCPPWMFRLTARYRVDRDSLLKGSTGEVLKRLGKYLGKLVLVSPVVVLSVFAWFLIVIGTPRIIFHLVGAIDFLWKSL